MNLNDYQNDAMGTAVFPTQNNDGGRVYAVLGLGNEAGELQGKLKKYLRGDYDLETADQMIFDELGDVLWYAAAVARSIGVDLSAVALANLNKLADRKLRGVIQGSGDKR